MDNQQALELLHRYHDATNAGALDELDSSRRSCHLLKRLPIGHRQPLKIFVDDLRQPNSRVQQLLCLA